jgi:hypothetical protein
MSDVAARLRILDELEAAAVREWGAAVRTLPHGAYVQMILCCALDRIHDGETRGFTRRKPPQPVALDVTKLQVGLLE